MTTDQLKKEIEKIPNWIITMKDGTTEICPNDVIGIFVKKNSHNIEKMYFKKLNQKISN